MVDRQQQGFSKRVRSLPGKIGMVCVNAVETYATRYSPLIDSNSRVVSEIPPTPTGGIPLVGDTQASEMTDEA